MGTVFCINCFSQENMSLEKDELLYIDLDELDEPHKLSKWILLLPKYRNDFENEYVDNNKLSLFIYESQLCGRHFKYNFDENNFIQILNIIYGENGYDYSDHKWMWQIIEKSQSNDGNIDDENIQNSKLEWIQSTWKTI